MPLIKRLKSKRRPGAAIPLPPLLEHFAHVAPRLESRQIELELIHARIADGYRNADISPVAPKSFQSWARPLDDEGLRRLALASSSLDLDEVIKVLPSLSETHSVERQLREGFVGLAREAELLTMSLLRQSALRVEEFARQFVFRLGAQIEDETPLYSAEQLHRLDYARLLAEADEAKASAEARMEHLRQLEEPRRPRRGKW